MSRGSLSRHAIACSPVVALCLAMTVSPVLAQQPVNSGDPGASGQASSEVLRSARAAQALFERRRLRYLPEVYGSSNGPPDERVGRFLTWYGEGEWYPVPEHPEIVSLRSGLVAELDSLQGISPGDGWILGQRVWYRAMGGQWSDALEAARSCGDATPWWCGALTGFSLHGLGRYVDAQMAFDEALNATDEETRTRWTTPRWIVDSSARALLETSVDQPAVFDAMLDRLWQLSDPLYLVDGNDRRTAHLARWTVTSLREGARNPFQYTWADDLTQLTVRSGWAVGWERSPSRDLADMTGVTSHKHPEGRDFMPPGSALEALDEAVPADFRADLKNPSSLYAPAYAPLLLPMEGQVAVFPRGQTMAVVATQFLPDDTTVHADHAHPRTWLEAGDQAGRPDESGLFLVPAADGSGVSAGVVFEARRRGRVTGGLVVEVPTGTYLFSSEYWSPERRRAGRYRDVIQERRALEDLATLSDIVLLRPTNPEPRSLEEAAETALPDRRVGPEEGFAVGWEVAGLGFRTETLGFEVSVVRTDRGVLSRVGSFLGLSKPAPPLTLSWEEASPDGPGHAFHYLNLDLPPLEDGRYQIRLVLRTADRSDAVSYLDFEVEAESVDRLEGPL